MITFKNIIIMTYTLKYTIADFRIFLTQLKNIFRVWNFFSASRIMFQVVLQKALKLNID